VQLHAAGPARPSEDRLACSHSLGRLVVDLGFRPSSAISPPPT